MRFFLEICFRGTRYKGWQVQVGARTVQAEVDRALSVVFHTDIRCAGCGRTDTGVHARQFFVHFDAPSPPSDDLLYKLNRILPEDIAAKRFIQVHPRARARQDAVHRTYTYFVHFRKDPFLTDASYYFPYQTPDIAKMHAAASLLRGYQDFRPLSVREPKDKYTRCTIFRSQWKVINDYRMSYTVTADHFLRGMVRRTVGAMLLIGTGKLTLDEFDAVMTATGRFRYIPAAPGCGLWLVSVKYPYIRDESAPITLDDSFLPCE
ncbi:MAG: tRNA pseudouridine synthase A [Chitinophagales bacterium]|nr:MAG: tRNA pseudouridine synthase A [Chitinophagales bacterium]